ncbi:MAG: hypothetical protein LQ338_008059, partial [Usnochroma carphineum]
MSTMFRASQVEHKESEVSHLDYSWGDFETGEDLAEAEFYKRASGLKERSDRFSPLRDPESPLDEGDLHRSEKKTAPLASLPNGGHRYGSVPPTPIIKPMVSQYDYSDSHGTSEPWNSLPPPRSNTPALHGVAAAIFFLVDTCADFEDAIDDRQTSFEDKTEEALRMLAKRIDMLTAQRLPQGNGAQLTNEEDPTDGARTPPQSPSSVSTPDSSAIQKYIQDWRKGGLLLVENISNQIPAREIYALFQEYGRVTYLELLGAEKSESHAPVRHAYIHYAELHQAHEARRLLHGFQLQNRRLMVFNLNTASVRGEPGKRYVGRALEILNFNDYDLREVSWEQDAQMPVWEPTATYSLKPQLTAKTAAASWRTTDVSGTGAAATQERVLGESADNLRDDEEITFK